VEITEDLAEGAGLQRFFELLRRHEGTDMVLCGHGDQVEELLQHLIEERVVEPSKAKLAKASTWELRTKGGRITAARYIPAP
jgi:phosphohistidine phosphatase SixA